jgi:hypothetical protein
MLTRGRNSPNREFGKNLLFTAYATFSNSLSFLRKQESIAQTVKRQIPAFAGMTEKVACLFEIIYNSVCIYLS